MLQLKCIKLSMEHSEETLFFSAKLYFNNAHVANVSNGGTGGPNNTYFICDKETKQKVIDFAKEKFKDSFEPLDDAVFDMIEKFILRKECLKNLEVCDAVVVVQKESAWQFIQITANQTQVKDHILRASVWQKYPDAERVILNKKDLPLPTIQ